MEKNGAPVFKGLGQVFGNISSYVYISKGPTMQLLTVHFCTVIKSSNALPVETGHLNLPKHNL